MYCQQCNKSISIRYGGSQGFSYCQSCFNRYKQLFSPLKKCECSPECQEMIHSLTTNNTIAKYKTGHQNRLRMREKHHNYKGGRKKEGYGYIMILRPHHPHANKKGYYQEHRYNVELQLGRYLTEDEVVHHIDGNIINNEISNLMLFSSHSDHLSYERTIDMSNRSCHKCKSKETYKRNGKYVWYVREQGYLCSICRDEERYDKIRKNVWRKKQ